MQNNILPKIWQDFLPQQTQDLLPPILAKLAADRANGQNILPPENQIFNAFAQTSPENVRVILLGQDPYPKVGDGMGLAFGVNPDRKIPASLKNIFKELQTDLHIAKEKMPQNGDLTSWAKQGVFLLNSALSVQAGVSGSHQKYGWTQFTDDILRELSQQKTNLVFMLWGNWARQKAILLDQTKHLILEAAHPSPLAGGAFFGSRPFSQANDYLVANGKTAINWV